MIKSRVLQSNIFWFYFPFPWSSCTLLKHRLKACERNVQDRWTQGTQKKLCGRLSHTVYSLVMIVLVLGALEELLFYTLEALKAMKLICVCIKLRKWFIRLLVLLPQYYHTSWQVSTIKMCNTYLLKTVCLNYYRKWNF